MKKWEKEFYNEVMSLIGEIREGINDLRQDMKRMEYNISNIRQDMKRMEYNISNIRQDMKRMEYNISNIRQEMDKLELRIDRKIRRTRIEILARQIRQEQEEGYAPYGIPQILTTSVLRPELNEIPFDLIEEILEEMGE